MEAARGRIEAALEKAVLLLGTQRRPAFPGSVHHCYGDKFALAELATQAALRGLSGAFGLLASEEALLGFEEEASRRAVSIRFTATERCRLLRQEERVVKQAHVNHGESWIEESVQVAWNSIAGQDKITVREDVWRIEVEWQLSAYAGADPSAARVLDRGQGWRELKRPCPPGARSEAPRAEVVAVPPIEAEIGWLVRAWSSEAPHFSIDRCKGSCKTPYRNEDVAAALQQLLRLRKWADSVREWLRDALLCGTNLPQGSLTRINSVNEPFQFVDSDGDVNRLAMDGNRLVWYEPNAQGGWRPWASGPMTFNLSTGELLASIAGVMGRGRATVMELDRQRLLRATLGGSLGLAEVEGAGSQAFPLVLSVFALEARGREVSTFSAEDLEQLAREHQRTVTERMAELAQIYPESNGQSAGVRLAALLQLLRELTEQHAAAVSAIEELLRAQLVAAVGKEVQSKDFKDLLRWHQQKAFRKGRSPVPFSYAIQQPGRSAEGHFCLLDEDNRELPTFALRRLASEAMQLPIAASVNVRFKGERFLHGSILSCFAEELQPLNLETRLRHFGCAVLVLGTVASTESFLPSAAIVLRGNETLNLPLLLQALPSAKEFRDATGSLSPEQRRFAECIRAMQLASTVFGICVIPVKPQLERLLALPEGSLTQEVKLTEELLELLLEYNIPSSLLRFNGSADADREARLAAVRQDVDGLRSFIAAEKQRELQEKERVQRIRISAEERSALEGMRRAAQQRDDAGQHYERLVKIVMFGAQGCGKSSLLSCYLEQSPPTTEYVQTIGVEFSIDNLLIDHKHVKVQMWDTGGDERFKTIQHSYLRGMHAAVLAVDLTNRAAFENLRTLHKELQEKAPNNFPAVIVGTKADLVRERQVTSNELDELGRELGFATFETSSMTDQCVVSAFLKIIREAVKIVAQRTSEAPESGPRLMCAAAAPRGFISSSRPSGPTARSRMQSSFNSALQAVSSGAAGMVERALQTRGVCCNEAAAGVRYSKRDFNRYEAVDMDGDCMPEACAADGDVRDCTVPVSGKKPHAASGEQQPSQSSEGRGEASQPSSPSQEPVREERELDCTSIPALLDKRCDEMGQGAALRPVIIKAGECWRKRSQKLLGAKQERSLQAEEQREERSAAFELLDVLSCAGSLVLEEASLHVLFLMAHCFDRNLMDVLVQQSVNALEPVERSSLILASTIYGEPVRGLLQPEDLERVGQLSPALLALQ